MSIERPEINEKIESNSINDKEFKNFLESNNVEFSKDNKPEKGLLGKIEKKIDLSDKDVLEEKNKLKSELESGRTSFEEDLGKKYGDKLGSFVSSLSYRESL